MGFTFEEKAFGKNDLRGIVGKVITPELFEQVGKAYAKYITDKANEEDKYDLWVSVAMDARNHSPELTKALIEGLISSGINVIDLGICPTPLGYFSEYVDFSKERAKDIVGTLIVTASHNPPEYNGLKMTYKKSSFTEQEIINLKEIVKKGKFINSHRLGLHRKFDIVPKYIEAISKQFSGIGKGVKVVVDSGNGTGGVVGPALYREIGCEVIDICTEPNGNFPTHHPDPSKESNVKFLKEKVLETGADFGIAFDGDSDRVGIVDNTGYSLPGDQLLLLFALDILKDLGTRNEKPVFISEVKCSQILYDMINENGGNAIMWKTGHAYIKSKMKEEDAILSGEMSGHTFFRDRYYGYDDAIYAGCRFIEIVAKNRFNNPNFKVSDLLDALPKAYTSREVRHACPDEFKQEIIDSIAKQIEKNPDLFGNKIEDIITLDGLRLVFKGGFALIRASNTEPTFTLRFEASTSEDTENYKNTMIKLIDESLNKLKAGV